MKKAKQLFAEFKSIFIGDDVLKENEEHANVVVATTMINLFIVILVVCILQWLNAIDLDVNSIIMFQVFIVSTIGLLLPGVYSLIVKGRRKYLKIILLLTFSVVLAILAATLTYTITLVMVIPIILSARYYSKKFTLFIAALTIILFAISTYLSVFIGFTDLNYVDVKQGNIEVKTTLEDAVDNLNLNKKDKARNMLLYSYIPKCAIYIVIVFATVQITRSGKKMIERQKEISKKGARIESELNIATNIQKNILPTNFPAFPDHKEFDIFASMAPAKEVGGDFYDMFLLDENHLAIAIGDVSGKGVPAALFMMIAKTLLKNTSNINEEVNTIFYKLNNMLCDGNKYGLFVTSWFGVLNLTTGKLQFVNAGHNPPVLYSNKKKKYDYLKTKPNFVLGGMENSKYDTREIIMNNNDKILIYTDGVVEANNKENALYGEERLLNLLNNNQTLDAEKTIKCVTKDIKLFSKDVEQFDDITMLCLEFKNKKTNEKEFKADKQELDNVTDYICSKVENKINAKDMYQLKVVIEEIFVNIASYAYKDNNGTCKVKVNVDNDKINIVFEDQGKEFNPLLKEDADVTMSAQEREIGGLGIFIVKKFMDECSYSRKNNKNILSLTKKINN